jgi:hypothetical protein
VEAKATADQPGRPSRAWPIAFMVGGGVLVATSIAFGAVAKAKSKQVQDAAVPGNRVFDSKLQAAERDGKAASGVAVLTGLLGVAAATTGVIFLLRIPSQPEAARSAAQVYPIAGPGLAGAGARWSF